MKQRRFIVAVMTGLVLSWMLVTIGQAEEIPRMTKEELKGILGRPEVIIIDVRSKADWAGSMLKIKGAVREDPQKVASWMGTYSKDKIIVFYCAWVKEATSASVALQFKDKGYTKVYALKDGWKEWQKVNFPTEKK